jgi:hypothetical protein
MPKVSKLELMPDILLEDKIRLYTIQIDESFTELDTAAKEYKASLLHRIECLSRNRMKYLKEQHARIEQETILRIEKMESEFKQLVKELLARPLPSMLPDSQ